MHDSSKLFNNWKWELPLLSETKLKINTVIKSRCWFTFRHWTRWNDDAAIYNSPIIQVIFVDVWCFEYMENCSKESDQGRKKHIECYWTMEINHRKKKISMLICCWVLNDFPYFLNFIWIWFSVCVEGEKSFWSHCQTKCGRIKCFWSHWLNVMKRKKE